MTSLRPRQKSEYEKAGEVLKVHWDAVIVFTTLLLFWAVMLYLGFVLGASTNFPAGL